MTKPVLFVRRYMPAPVAADVEEAEEDARPPPVTLPTIEPGRHAAAFRAALDRHDAKLLPNGDQQRHRAVCP
jgi:hypothetical protein